MKQQVPNFANFPLQLFLALILFVNCHAQDTSQQNVVARIAGKYTISFPELRQYVADFQYYYKYRKNIAKVTDKALEDMIVNRMKIIDFFAMGLNEKRETFHGMMRVLNEELEIKYFMTQFYTKYVNEKSIQNAYKQMGKEVIYRQIVLAKPDNASPKTLHSLKDLAKIIKIKIDGGADFAGVTKQYSQDVNSRNRDGLMPPLNWKMSLSSGIEDTIFHLAVNETRIVESKQAIHVVKIDAIDTVHVPPYVTVKEEIRKALEEKYVHVTNNEFDKTKKNLVNERKLQWNAKAIQQLLRWSNIPNFYAAAYSDTLTYAISHGNNFLILKYSKEKLDLKEYLRLLNEVLTLGNYTVLKEDKLKLYILEAIRTDKIVNKTRGLDLEKDIFNPQTKNPYIENGIMRLYNSQVIEKQIPPATNEALTAFYKANRDSLFYQLAKVNIYALIDSSKSAIEEMKQRLDQKVPFEKLAREILVKTFIRKRDGMIGSYLSIEPPYLGEAAFKLRLFEISGPIEYKDTANVSQYALIKSIAIREEKQLTYDDVKKTIADECTNYHRKEITSRVEEQLKKKYIVEIYKDVLKQQLSSTGIKLQE